jgi:membrane-bound lytic murein transglycosylase A
MNKKKFLINIILPSISAILLSSGCSSRFEDETKPQTSNKEQFQLQIEKIFPNLKDRNMMKLGEMELIETDYVEIRGWKSDTKFGSFEAFLRGCEKPRPVNMPQICNRGRELWGEEPNNEDLTKFFEDNFTPYFIADNKNFRWSGTVTGYYVPLLNGSRKKTSRFKYPIYSKPEDFKLPYKTHEEIDKNPPKAKIICWVDDRIERLFLHIQGSGSVKLEDGSIIGVGFSAKNGYEYSSVGGYIYKHYGVPLYKLSADYITKWIEEHPNEADKVLYSNKSFVFFSEQTSGRAYGAMATNLVPKSTIAVDTKYIPLGMPIYIKSPDKPQDKILNHLFMAQDRGGAIKGVIRADLFFGFGKEAGDLAGKMKRDGEFYMLVPRGYKFTN